MYSVFVQCEPRDEDTLIAEMWEAGTEGILEEPGGIRAFFEEYPRFGGVVRREPDTDWARVSRDAFQPMLVGDRFFLIPEWRHDPTPEGRLRLEINPGRACGTGQHPCTQLCLEALERYLRPGDRVLDVGTGSGILLEAAALLDAGLMIGCDVDPDAVTVARERVVTPLFVGSLDAVQSASMDVIVANISATAIAELDGEFRRVRKAGSTLILSGFPEWEIREGFEPREILRKDEWVCLVT